MTWEELKEKAIEKGYRLDNTDCCFEVIREPIGEEIPRSFYKDGDIFIDGTLISRKRTPDQMYQIMLALR